MITRDLTTRVFLETHDGAMFYAKPSGGSPLAVTLFISGHLVKVIVSIDTDGLSVNSTVVVDVNVDHRRLIDIVVNELLTRVVASNRRLTLRQAARLLSIFNIGDVVQNYTLVTGL